MKNDFLDFSDYQGLDYFPKVESIPLSLSISLSEVSSPLPIFWEDPHLEHKPTHGQEDVPGVSTLR